MGRKLINLKRWFRRRSRRGGAAKPIARTSCSSRKGKNKHRECYCFPRKFIFLITILLLLSAFAHSFYRFDRRILPLVLEAAELRIQTEINNVINSVVHEIIVANQVTAADFILQNQIITDARPVLSVNTVLANEICNVAAQEISARLNNLEPEIVSVPIGMALGLDTLSQIGPRFTFTMAPIGNALVNYESHFTAVGINQTHFSVWLTVDSVVRIINPVQSSEIHVTRHVSLVDTIISGTVPGTYLNMDAPTVNLN